ncbi:MAG: tetratricopeptide repeat protein, partial [Candidatus Margulisiibacteriota bacterium]
MRSWLIGALIVMSVAVPAFAVSYKDMDDDGVSLKAGPTDVTEELSLAWVEAALYPKAVEKGREVFLEVRLASPVKLVKLNLDTEKGSLPLFSDDNKNWSRVVKVDPGAIAGLHAARVTIVGNNNSSIQRNLEFVVKDEARTEKEVPLTVLNVTQVYDSENGIKQLLPGYKMSALYKTPFYRVKLNDGKEGWVEASRVKEPTEDLYLLGYRAFENKNYSEAINNFKQVLQYDPQNPRTHLFLARIYA